MIETNDKRGKSVQAVQHDDDDDDDDLKGGKKNLRGNFWELSDEFFNRIRSVKEILH